MSSSNIYLPEDDQVLASLTPEQRRLFDRMEESVKQEKERVKQEKERVKQEMELTRQAAERAEQALSDAAAVRKALADEQVERQQLHAGQTVDDYISREFQRNFHLPRLLPKLTTTKPKSSSEKSITATTGRTSIIGKYYPLKLELWEGCDAVLATAFQEIRASLGSRPLFPSKNRMDAMNDSFLEDLPFEFVNAPLYLTELRTSFFLHEVLEKPVSRVLNAFFSAHRIFFDNQNAGAHIQFITRERTQESSRSEQESDAGSQTSKQASGEEQGGTETDKKKPKVPNKVQPDCIVLCTKIEAAPGAAPDAADQSGEAQIDDDDDGDDDDDDNDDNDDSDDDESTGEEEPASAIYRIAFGEHKAAHRLRAVMLDRLLKKGIAQDYIVQMARRKATGIPSTDAESSKNAKNTKNTKNTVPGSFPGQVYYTYALAQTFHYMVSAGILYGYLASGDTLTFLHIPPAEPTTLMYRPFVFPQFGRANVDTDAATEAPPEETVSLERSTVGLLSGMAFLAWQTGAQDERWRTDALHKLAKFPDLPESMADSAAALSDPDSPSSPADSDQSSKRGSDSMDDDDAGDSRGRRRPGHHLSAPHAHRPRVPSPLQWHESSTDHQSQHAWQGSRFGPRKPVFLQPSQFDPVSFRPIRPYCTQACLLGLARGLPLDNSCPNVLLHQRAARDVMTADDVLPGRQGQMFHAIRGIEELDRLLVLQLYGNIMQDCECFLNKGFLGRIGCLFKLTLTGYGYTFVAKGVQSFDRRRLRRETAVYKHLSEQQGRLVPVYLGIVKLLLPYPRDDALLVSHMMLMSYGGPKMWSRVLARRTRRRGDLASVDLEREAARTWDELQALGVDDSDVENMENNFTWCDESQRMMRIDFHCASVAESSARVPVSEEHVVEHKQEYDTISAEATPQMQTTSPTLDSARVKRQRPIDWSHSDEGDARAAKRMFCRRGSESSLGSLVLL